MQISKCLGHFILRLILLLFWSCKGLAQSSSSFSSTESPVSSTVSSSSDSTTWTFVGTGYLTYHPTLVSNQNQDYKLSFRTRHSFGTLFCHILKDYKKEDHLFLESYKFCVELYQGSLHVTYNLNKYTDTVVIGKVLNDDKWHSLEVQLAASSGNLIVTLDGISRSRPLTSYLQTNPASILTWNTLSSVLLYGGQSSESHRSNFIGCLKNHQLLDNSNLTVVGSVQPGCPDKCKDRCQGGTPCKNYYTHVKCDCFGTDLQGRFCDQSGSTKVTLRGYEWLTYQLYATSEDKTVSDKNRFSLQFKSDRGSGVLIYAVGDDNHVIASVHRGIVKVSVGFAGHVTLEAELGSNANNYRWHNLTIFHNKNTVTFHLDDEIQVKQTDSSDYYLSLDPQIFFGGGNNFVITKGLQVTQNFMGCLKNVYVNDVSLVYEMKVGNPRVIHSGGSEPQYGCHKVENIPITFPKSGTMIVLNNPSQKDLQVEFGFRTVRDKALIFYAEVISMEDYDIGFFEIWIQNHQVILHEVPSTRNTALSTDLVIDRVVNNNNWHTLHLHFTENSTYIKIDHLSKVINHTKILELTEQIVIGYGRKAYDVNDGFVGCIQNLVINKKEVDAVRLLQDRFSVYGVILDGCNLIPHCNGGPHCEHGGKCLSDWDGITCDCSDTAYEGQACHFSKFRQSCDSYYQAGYRQTGAYQVDLDGTGPLKPAYMWCVMDYQYNGETYGMTNIDHNLIPKTQIRGKGMYDMRKILSYRGLSREELVKLTQRSTWCQQLVEYDCYSAPLKLGKSTIFTSASGGIVDLRYDKDDDSLCSCRKGTCPANRCICDQGHAQWEKDSGYIRYKQYLPITEIRIIQSKTQTHQTEAKLSLSPLHCWGDETSRVDSSVSFLTTTSYLRLRPWTSDSLHFMYRTHEKTALLLNQTQSLDNTNNLVIELTTDDLIKFTIRVNNKTLDIELESDRQLSDGNWHYVAIEMDMHNIRCSVDKEKQMIDMPGGQIPSFHGHLFIGGYLNEDIKPGLKGCMRGFNYNNKGEDLSKLTHHSKPEVIGGCRASCQSNPCQNGARCIEHWGSYSCICTNQWAHWGESCEINVNKDEVSFDGGNTSYLDLDGMKDDRLLDSTIILSFRTRTTKALLLYIYDSMNNFLQLELERGDRLKLSYNHYKTIVSGNLDMRNLNDGEWKQVVIQEETKNNNLQTKMFVDSPENMLIIPYSRLKLQKYSTYPFIESVKPPRSEGASNIKMNDYYRLFVGGAPINSSFVEQLPGCVRGLKIGNKVYSLQQEAHHNPAIATLCSKGCSPNPCQHKGVCIERWGYKAFECDCSKTNYAGNKCQIEATGNFTGKSVLEYNFDLIRTARYTTSEKFLLTFQTNYNLSNQEAILAVVMSSKHQDHDLLMFKLNAEGVGVKHYQKRVAKGLMKLGDYADGKPHRLKYWRSRGEMLLTLDDESVARVPNIQNPLDELDKIMIGGVVQELLPNYIEYQETFINFTGCISEVIFTPETNPRYEYKPMKELRSFTNKSILIHGNEIPGCLLDSETDMLSTTEVTTVSPTVPEDRTMPPWNPGPAETICSGCPPSTTVATTVMTTSSTVQTVQTIPTTPVTTTVTRKMNMSRSASGQITGTATELEIVVALGIIVGLALISIMIALILCKKRKREKYIKKKVPPDDFDFEQKVPLNHQPSPPPSQRPYDHIARLDEFSMISVTLGPKKRKENGIISPGTEPLLSDGDNSPGDYPIQSTFYNKKKNRPASSISEVLEEMERQKREKDGDQEQDEEMKQKSDLEWDPLTDRTPLTSVPQYDTISEDFIYKMLPTPILSVMDDIEELSVESASTFSTLNSMEKQEEGDSDVDPLQILEQQKELTMEGNGDSGYEAESRKDGDDDVINITPPTPEKMYMYDISGHGNQNWCSTPSQKLLDYEETGT